MLLLVMLAGLVLSDQEVSSLTGPPTTLPMVEVVASGDGAATLECRVSHDGRLRDCIVISETPAGQGFGQAALEAASRARLSREILAQAARDAKVRFTTRFRLDETGRPLT